jgi:Transcription termination factor
VPEAVAISEALELATNFSTEDSSKYINGVLSKVLEIKPDLVL